VTISADRMPAAARNNEPVHIEKRVRERVDFWRGVSVNKIQFRGVGALDHL